MTFSRKDNYILWACFAVLWTLVWIRAINVPVLPDEVFSYFLYGEPGYYFQPKAQLDANNHLVNSVLTHLSVKTFGASLLSIRLPNVLCFIVYFISILGISKQQTTKGGFWITFVSFSGIFYLLEFFSLSRGYGMSFAFLLLAIWQLMRLQARFKWKNACLILIAVALGLGSNLSLFFVFVPVFAYVVLLVGIYVRKHGFGTLFPAMLLTGGFAAVLFVFYKYIILLNNEKMLYYGMTVRFPYASIQSLLLEITDHDWSWMYYMLLILVCAIVALFAVRLFSQAFIKSVHDNRVVFAVLLFTTLAGITASVLIMKTPAPSERTGAHLIPLFVGAALFLFPHFDKSRKSSYSQLLFLGLPLASLFMVNVSTNHFWFRDQIDETAYELILKEAKKVKEPVTISGARYFDRMYFFNNTLRDNKLPTYDFDSWPNDRSDFLFLTIGDYQDHPEIVQQYRQLFQDKNSENRLYIRKQLLAKKLNRRFYESREPDSLEFLSLASLFIDSTSPRNFIADVRCRFRFEESGECFTVCGAYFDEKGNSIMLKEPFHLNHLKSNWNTLALTRFTIPFFNVPKEAREIRLYIYNDKKVPHQQFRALTSVYEVE